MKAIHPLPVALVIAFLNALACTSDFPAGVDHGASGGSGPGGGRDAGTGGVAGDTTRDVDSATAVGGAASGGTSGGTGSGGIGTGGATGVGGTVSGGTSVVVDAAGTSTGGAPSSGGAGGSGPSPEAGGVGADAALDLASGMTPDSDSDWAKDSGGGAHDGDGSGPDSADASIAARILDLFPRNNSVAGWTVDPDYPVTAALIAVTATTQIAAENLIDGAAADFFAGPNIPVIFAWQNYVNRTLPSAPPPDGAKLSLFILQMAGTPQAAGLYDDLRSASLYDRPSWVDPSSPSIGTRSRIADTGDRWWINFYKGNYYVEVSLSPSYGPAPDYVPGNANTKAAAIQFAQAVASAM